VTPPTSGETSTAHQCWWRGLAEGLSATLAELDNDGQTSALREMLRGEKRRRRAAEDEAVIWRRRAEQAGWLPPA
jgi:hypothetical protein